MIAVALLGALLTFSTPVENPVENQPADLANRMPAHVVRTYDGDTLTADVSIWPGITIRTSIRIRGIDTPELRARCDEERTMAVAARDLLRRLVADAGHAVQIVDPEHGMYAGRVVAGVEAGGIDVAAALLDSGLARVYDGGRRQGWC